MYLKIIMRAFLLLAGVQLQAQQINIKDAETQVPVTDAMLQFYPGNQIYFSDKNGQVLLPENLFFETILVTHVDFISIHLTRAELVQMDFNMRLKRKPIELDEVMVTANKTAQSIRDVATQALVIDPKKIVLSHSQTTAELLQSTGEILVQKSQQGGGSPILRGFEANKILLVLDGVRLNNAIYRGGHLQNIITTDPLVMDRVEIVFGPASVLYGSDALGGVIHLISRKPRLTNDSTAQFKLGSMLRYSTANEEKTIGLRMELAMKKFAWLGAFSFSDFGDLRQGASRDPFHGDWGKKFFNVETANGRDTVLQNARENNQSPSGYKQYHLTNKFLWFPAINVEHQLNIQYSTSSDIPRYDRLTELDGNGRPRFAEWYYGPQLRFLSQYQLTLGRPTAAYDDLKFNGAYQHIGESRHDRRFSNPVRNNRIEKLNILDLGLDAAKNYRKHILHYGLDASYQRVHSEAYALRVVTNEKLNLDTRYPDGKTGMALAGIYFTHQWKYSAKLNFQEGVRLQFSNLFAEFVDTSFFNFPIKKIDQSNVSFDGSLGMLYKLHPRFHLHMNASSAFRVPNIDDLGKVFETVSGSLILPNAQLKPEKLYNVELGFRSYFEGKSQFSCSAYYGWYRDVITLTKTNYQGMDSIFYNGIKSQVLHQDNAAKARVYGIHGSLLLQLNEHWNLSSVLTYTVGKIETDTTDYPLDHIPPVFGKTALSFAKDQWTITTSVFYNGWKSLEDTNIIGEDNIRYATPFGTPAWWTLNMAVDFKLNAKLRIQCSLENILDRHYRVFASGIGAPGRNVSVALRSEF